MKQNHWFYILLICSFSWILQSQERKTIVINYQANQIELQKNELDKLRIFIHKTNPKRIESIIITDKSGNLEDDHFNPIVQQRLFALKNDLTRMGFNNKIIAADNYYPEDKESNNVLDTIEIEIHFKKQQVVLPDNVFLGFPDSLNYGDRVILTKINFEQGRSVLNPKAKRELRGIAKRVKNETYYNFEIHGHICCTPKRFIESYDKDTKLRELSKNRAEQVYNFLIECKVDPNRMKFVACGNQFSLNLTPDMDRRVEFYITKPLL